jgi:putative transposase
MTCSIRLTDQQRNLLLQWYQHYSHAQVSRRCHMILLLDDGHSYNDIAENLYCSSSTIARWKDRFLRGGIEALRGQKRGPGPKFSPCWPEAVTDLVDNFRPTDFGYYRSRWCCWLLACVLQTVYGLYVSRETVRRWLHQEDYVYRRPRPVLRREDPKRAEILRGLRRLLLNLPEDETVVFQDEADVNLNPEIGCAWMLEGEQAEVETPGNNKKRYLAGSLHWRTGAMITTTGEKRDSELFLDHIDELRRSLRRYKTIHIILDNAGFHDCQAVAEYYYRWYGRIQFHFLPKYAPDLNPIERVWWHLREEITRNHRCQNIDELIELVFGWLENRSTFEIEGSAYADLQEN